VKENVSCGVPLACRNLSLAVKELWDGGTRIVRRGERQNQQFFYLNLCKKSAQPQPMPSMNSTNDSFSSLFSHHNLPSNWTSVDHRNCLNFIHLENSAYRQNRVKTESKQNCQSQKQHLVNLISPFHVEEKKSILITCFKSTPSQSSP
jgi:hypothetical protein